MDIHNSIVDIHNYMLAVMDIHNSIMDVQGLCAFGFPKSLSHHDAQTHNEQFQ